jgi:hypothetical protein
LRSAWSCWLCDQGPKWNNAFGRLRRKLYPDVDPLAAAEAIRVARLYGQRPEIYRRLSWQALVELSSVSLSPQARAQFEAKIIAGESVNGAQIASAAARSQMAGPSGSENGRSAWRRSLPVQKR